MKIYRYRYVDKLKRKKQKDCQVCNENGPFPDKMEKNTEFSVWKAISQFPESRQNRCWGCTVIICRLQTPES